LRVWAPDVQTLSPAEQAHDATPDVSGSDPAELAISTRNLRKVFREKVAVRGLTLDVRRGEVFGFLGPNGAGKSTSVKMLLGLVRPTFGSALLLGKPIGDRESRRRVGFLPEHFRFYDWLTSEELLRVHGELCGLEGRDLATRIQRMLDLVGLTPHAGKQLREYSKGMLQRIGLAQALIHEPDLIILDEPTSGLDPVGRRLVRDVIRAQKERGATVFLNSHLLSEVEVTCDRVAFIRAGKTIEIREVKEFERSYRNVAARVGGLTEDALPDLEAWAEDIQLSGSRLTMRLHEDEFAPRVVQYLVDHGIDVYEFTPQRATLEDRFLEIVNGDEGL
jgi:ABC-2 type transport system ATP-binding protein